MKRINSLVLVLILLLYPHSNVLAQGSAFTYQGRLSDGSNPANGTYDLVFVIYDAPTGPGVFASLFNYATVISNGLFTVTLDFGAGMFPGADRWLEVGVRTNGGSTFTMMSPRQKFTATPYAITAGNLTGVVPSAGLAGTYSGAVMLNNPANSYIGNGGGLTNVNALTLNGLATGSFWQLGGNNVSPLAFLGTTNNQAFEIRVNNTRGLRIEPTGGAPSLVGGYFQNTASGPGAVVAGGGTSGSINEAAGMYAFVGCGLGNTNRATASVIVGGSNNVIQADSDASVIGGGALNTIREASQYSTIGGGTRNTVHTGAYYSTIDGGTLNEIGLNASFSAIGGGILNSIQESAFYSAIGGGAFDTIQANSPWSAIGGGYFNVVEPYASYSAIGGGMSNSIQANSFYGTIGGGALNLIGSNAPLSSIGGGDGNSAQGVENTIGGGTGNRTRGLYATAGGGANNAASDLGATVAGGGGNKASGQYAAVGGGYVNTASGQKATVPGGLFNSAIGDNSFAAGFRAKANHDGSFVWADLQNADFNSTANNQFNIRAVGGVRLSVDTSLYWGAGGILTTNQGGSIELGPRIGNGETPFIDFHFGVGVEQDANVRLINDANEQLTIARANSPTPMARFNTSGLTINGTFVSSSDRNLKENFQSVNASEMLDKVVGLPLSKWNYKDDSGSTHIGPMAQEFYAAFGVGPDDKHIATVDADGVALAAIQGLNQKVEQQQGQLKQRDLEITELRQRLDQLEKRLSDLSDNRSP